MFRIVLKAALVLSLVGLCYTSYVDGNYKTAALGLLYAIANTVIFCVPG